MTRELRNTDSIEKCFKDIDKDCDDYISEQEFMEYLDNLIVNQIIPEIEQELSKRTNDDNTNILN